jgi:hypothetical protein
LFERDCAVKKKTEMSPVERFIALSDAEKDAEVAEFEKGIDPKDWHPLTPSQRKQWARVKRKMGRPAIGQGSKVVAVTIERGLLEQADRYAKTHAIKRAEMIAEGLRLVLGKRAG